MSSSDVRIEEDKLPVVTDMLQGVKPGQEVKGDTLRPLQVEEQIPEVMVGTPTQVEPVPNVKGDTHTKGKAEEKLDRIGRLANIFITVGCGVAGTAFGPLGTVIGAGAGSLAGLGVEYGMKELGRSIDKRRMSHRSFRDPVTPNETNKDIVKEKTPGQSQELIPHLDTPHSVRQVIIDVKEEEEALKEALKNLNPQQTSATSFVAGITTSQKSGGGMSR